MNGRPADDTKQIEAAVSEFMGSKRVAWATPGTPRHSSNFFGDTHLCRFTKSELVQCVECYWTNYADQLENIEAAIGDILADMQLDKPGRDCGRLKRTVRKPSINELTQ